MQVQLSSSSAAAQPCDILARLVGSNLDELADLDTLFDGQLRPLLAARNFEGKAGTQALVPTFGRLEARELLLVGTGDNSAHSRMKAAGLAGRAARTQAVAHLAIDPGADADDAAVLLEMAAVGNYEYQNYKSADSRTASLDTLTLLGEGDVSGVSVMAKWQSTVRDLVNAPPAEIYPESLAEAAKKLGELEHVTVEVWDFDRCKAEGCVGVVAVGQGSARKSCLVRISYRPPNAREHIALVGKGVTFDAGGLSLKPSSGMLTMRCDMGGAATVLGVTGAAAELGVPVAIDTFIGAAENMVSGDSYKLGDILEYSNGVSVEIHNTDAEGRLVLADCLIQASKIDTVTHIVDLATLTGACVVALGSELTAVFTDDDTLWDGIRTASDHTGEGVWRLPLQPSYKKLLRAEWATIKNVGGRAAGSITAALYLQHFVGEGKRWAHLDIAGSAFWDAASGPYVAGGTGQMTRSLVRWLQSF